MTLKELSQLSYLNQEIEKDRLRIMELQDAAEKTTTSITGLPSGTGKSDKTGNNAIEIADLKEIINANIERCWCELKRLNNYIINIDDSLTRQIFTLRFIEGLTWRQVATKIGGGNTEGGIKNICYRFLEDN